MRVIRMDKNGKILIVDDAKSNREILSEILNQYTVIEAKDGYEALEYLKSDIKSVALVLLDLFMPEMDGFEVCRQIRDKVRVPIVMVTARLDDIDKIRGLGVGADDYIEKPFSPSVLIAKIKAMLAQYKRLTERDAMETNAIQSGEIRLDPKMMKVWVNEKEVHLKKKEFQLLEFLMRNRDIVFSKEELYSRVWGLDSYGDYATVAVHINRLREEIEDNPSDSKHIITVWGVGYKFV